MTSFINLYFLFILFATIIHASPIENVNAPSCGLTHNRPHSVPIISVNKKQNGTDHIQTTNRQYGCQSWNQCSFLDNFYTNTWNRWEVADEYTNGIPFNSWWSRKKLWINTRNGNLVLSIGKEAKHGTPYASGHLKSKNWHGYGCYEASMKPVSQKGLVTTFFSYTGPWDATPGSSGKHNEIDIEFVWRKEWGKTVMQTNYFTNGGGKNEKFIPLSFNPSASFHNYGFRWTSRKIEWYVDGQKVYETSKNIPKAYNGHHKIMANLWPVSKQAEGWAGRFTWSGNKNAVYNGIRFTRGEHCRIHNSF